MGQYRLGSLVVGTELTKKIKCFCSVQYVF